MEANFPNHKPTLHRFRGKHPYYFPPKLDGIWDIEECWGVMSQEVYREMRPTHIDAIIGRVRESSLKLTSKIFRNFFLKHTITCEICFKYV